MSKYIITNPVLSAAREILIPSDCLGTYFPKHDGCYSSPTDSIPNLDADQVEKLFYESNSTPPQLKYIKNGHAIFESNFKTPITILTDAKYSVNVCIPITHDFFYSQEEIKYINKLNCKHYITFKFNGYSNKKTSLQAYQLV